MEDKLKNMTISQALIIGVVLTAIYYFAIYDDGTALENQIATIQKQIETNKSEIEVVRKAIQDAERYQLAKQALGAEMEKVLLAIPQKLTSTDLMKLISNEAKTVGAEISRLNASGNNNTYASAKDKNEQFYEPVEIEVGLGGTYNQLMLFLSNLTKLDKILTSKNMTLAIRRDGTVGATPSLTLSATFQAYRYKTEEAGK